MVSRVGYFSRLDEAEIVKNWIRSFAAKFSVKSTERQQGKKGGIKITGVFLASAGCETIMRIFVWHNPNS